MIKKFLSKYILEVIPSIVATVVGAYIVTHYINARPDADKPKAAISAPVADVSGDKAVQETPKAEAARLKAEKLAAEKAAAERAAVDRAENAKRAADKLAAEKASAEKAAADRLASEKAAADKRERERTVAKAPAVTPQPDTNAAPERDANDLARAAIDRLRKASPQPSEASRAPEAARTEEAARPQPERAKVNSVVYAPAPATTQPQVQPLPPAVTVAPPPPEVSVAAPPAPFPRPMDETRDDDSSRPTPPANIPLRPLDLRAQERGRSVAEGVVAAARSVFQAVIPERN